MGRQLALLRLYADHCYIHSGGGTEFLGTDSDKQLSKDEDMPPSVSDNDNK
jgi:hypothetical protein